MALRESDVERYRVRDHEPAYVRATVAARIGNEIMGDDMITGRGWPK